MNSMLKSSVSIARALKGIIRIIGKNNKIKIGFCIFLALLIVGFASPYINRLRIGDKRPHDLGVGRKWEQPSIKFPLGTDDYGRDIFGMLLVGIMYSLSIGLLAGAIATLIAVTMGFISGYKGGFVDHTLRTFTDTLLVIPLWPIYMAIATYIPKLPLESVALLLGIFSWPGAARVIRAQVLSLKERAFVKLAKLNMLNDLEIVFLELLPNIAPYIIIGFINSVMGAIFAETGLRLIGIGPPLLPTLGYLLSITIGLGMLSVKPYVVAAVVGVLALIFISLNLINIGLEEEFNPRLKKVTGL